MSEICKVCKKPFNNCYGHIIEIGGNCVICDVKKTRYIHNNGHNTCSLLVPYVKKIA